jgi:hypothetical protein
MQPAKIDDTYTIREVIELVRNREYNLIFDSQTYWLWALSKEVYEKDMKFHIKELYGAFIYTKSLPVFTTNITHIRDLLHTGK